MAEPLLSSLAMLTEFFSAAQIEAAARRTGFVPRAAKITGKLFLALVPLGSWSTAKTALAQLAATAAQVPKPVEVSPEARQQRRTRRARAFLQEMIQRAFAKLHPGVWCQTCLTSLSWNNLLLQSPAHLGRMATQAGRHHRSPIAAFQDCPLDAYGSLVLTKS